MTVREIPGVQNPVVRHARATGWLAWKMRIEGRNGCPDFLMMKNGAAIWMEFKSPTGSLSPQQHLRIKDLRDHGFEVHVVDDPEVGKRLLDEAFDL